MNNEQPSDSRWSRFWFAAIPTTGIEVLRVLSGLLFCFWLLSFLGHQEGFFSLRGWFDSEGYLAIQTQRQQDALGAPMGWSMLYLAGESAPLFNALYWGSVAVLVLFTLGVATRITSVLAWMVVVSFLANPATNYEGDYLLGILAFHLMIGHLLLGQWNGNLSTVERILGSKDDFLFANLLWKRDERAPSFAANFMMRLLQLHFALIIVTSGLHKLQIGDWWAGSAFWYALHPPFQTTVESLVRERAGAPTLMFFLSLIQYGALAWQITFPIFAWRQGTFARTLLLGGAVLGWIGVVYIFKLPLFGPFVVICSLSYLRPEEWARLKERAIAMMQRSTEAKETRTLAKMAGKK